MLCVEEVIYSVDLSIYSHSARVYVVGVRHDVMYEATSRDYFASQGHSLNNRYAETQRIYLCRSPILHHTIYLTTIITQIIYYVIPVSPITVKSLIEYISLFP